VDTQHVADLEQNWIDNILNLIPTKLQALTESVQTLSAEMREDYHMSVKKAIGTWYSCSRFCAKGSKGEKRR
jgi:dynein heavy chain